MITVDSPSMEYKSVLHLTAKRENEIQMNLKQIELAEDLLSKLKAAYPQVEHLGYARDPDDKQIVWILVEAPIADEDEEVIFRRFHNDLTNEICNTFGYDFFVMSYNPLIQIPLYSK